MNVSYKTRRITLSDSRTFRVLPTGGGEFIMERGCSKCGHGLLVWANSYRAKCIWEDKEVELDHNFVDEIRSKIPV